jgi:hypothetical protein
VEVGRVGEDGPAAEAAVVGLEVLEGEVAEVAAQAGVGDLGWFQKYSNQNIN